MWWEKKDLSIIKLRDTYQFAFNYNLTCLHMLNRLINILNDVKALNFHNEFYFMVVGKLSHDYEIWKPNYLMSFSFFFKGMNFPTKIRWQDSDHYNPRKYATLQQHAYYASIPLTQITLDSPEACEFQQF